MKNKQKRDYKAEYKRRIERGLARGLTLSQARGHPKAKEKHIGKSRPIPENVIQISLKELRSGKSLTAIAREVRVSPERLRNQVQARGAIRKKNNRWKPVNDLPREMLIYTNGEEAVITVGKLTEASKIGRYMSAVAKFIRTNNPSGLAKFSKKYAKDIKGKKYLFETDPNTLYRLANSGTETFEQVYRIAV